MTTKTNPKQCTAHYTAPGSPAYRFRQMEIALRVIRTWAKYDMEHNHSAEKILDAAAIMDLCDKALEK